MSLSPIIRIVYFPASNTQQLIQYLTSLNYGAQWSLHQQQRVFNSAMSIYNNPNATAANKGVANHALRALTWNHNRTWQNNPPAFHYRNAVSNSNSNSNGNGVAAPAAPQRPYKNVVHRAVSKWRRGPVQLVPLPNNAPKAPITLHNFKKGHEAIRHTRRNATGRSSNRYYTVKEFQNLVGKSWGTIYRMKPSSIVFDKDPMNRRRIYRRELSLVKFI